MVNTMQHVPGLGEGYWWRTKFNCETGRKNSGRKKFKKMAKSSPLHAMNCRKMKTHGRDLKVLGWVEDWVEERRSVKKKSDHVGRGQKSTKTCLFGILLIDHHFHWDLWHGFNPG